MEKGNEILISFGKSKNDTSREIHGIKLLSFQEIEKACEEYVPDINYLEVLANLLYLKSIIKKQEDENEFS